MDSGIVSLESIPGLLKRLQIWAQATLENIVYSDSCLKKNVPRFFGPFCARSASKFAKNANLTQKKNFQIILIWESINTEFDADFESIEKVVKKCLRKRLFA